MWRSGVGAFVAALVVSEAGFAQSGRIVGRVISVDGAVPVVGAQVVVVGTAGDASHNITPAELTMDFILDERVRELLWEGHRRTDLIRYGRFTTAGIWAWKGNVVAGKATEAFRNLYPLPASELLANPNLKQNTGY